MHLRFLIRLFLVATIWTLGEGQQCGGGRFYRYDTAINQMVCSPCSTGWYKPVGDTGDCTEVTSGYYAEGTECMGAISQTRCGLGRYTEDGCACNLCAVGKSTQWPDGIKWPALWESDCKPCKSGTYEKDRVCEDCAVEEYQNEWMKTSCKSCPTGQTSPTRSTGTFQCTPCSEGTYENMGTCVDCGIGTYQDETGSSSCKACEDSETSGVGAIKCYTAVTDWTDDPCENGLWPVYETNDGVQSLECHTCPTQGTARDVGWYRTKLGEDTCFMCTAGNFANNPDTGLFAPPPTQCAECASGSYSTDAQEHYTQYPGGTTNNGGETSAISCTNCAAGKFSKPLYHSGGT